MFLPRRVEIVKGHRHRSEQLRVSVVYNGVGDSDMRLSRVIDLLLRSVIEGTTPVQDEQTSISPREKRLSDSRKEPF